MNIDTTPVSASMPIQPLVSAQANAKNLAANTTDTTNNAAGTGSSPAVKDAVAGGAVASPQQKAENIREQVNEAVQKINDMIKVADRDLEFSVDKDTDMNVVKVIDSQSKEVIRQIPSEEVIQIAKALDKLQGLLVRDKA